MITSFVLLAVLSTDVDGPEVVARGATVEKLWDQGSFTEGGALAWDGSILFPDIGDRIIRFDPGSKQVTPFRDPGGRANGLIFDPKGRPIVAEGPTPAAAVGSRSPSLTATSAP